MENDMRFIGLRERQCRRLRKKIQEYGTITREELLNIDEDGTLLPREEWGYCVEAKVNGRTACSPDDSWYGAYLGCLEGAKWAMEQEPMEERESDDAED